MRKEKAFIYVSKDVIEGYINYPDDAGKRYPTVIFTNGWGAYHEMYDAMAETLCDAGYITLQFEPRGSAGPRREYQLCGTEWKDDLNAAISYMWGCPEVDRERIGLTGVSMGGAMTLIQGAVDPRIKALYAMAPYINGPISDKDRIIRQGGENRWRSLLELMYDDAAARAHGWEGEKMPANYTYATDSYFEPDERLKGIREKYPLAMIREPYESTWNVYLYVDALTAVRNIRIPTMITHGTGDSLLRWEDSEMLFNELAAEHKEFHLIDGAEHALPLTATEDSIRYGLKWFGKYL